eukprot:3287937-Rhodomonas_salina.1
MSGTDVGVRCYVGQGSVMTWKGGLKTSQRTRNGLAETVCVAPVGACAAQGRWCAGSTGRVCVEHTTPCAAQLRAHTHTHKTHARHPTSSLHASPPPLLYHHRLYCSPTAFIALLPPLQSPPRSPPSRAHAGQQVETWWQHMLCQYR